MTEARQRQESDTEVLVTELRRGTGVVWLTDALALHAGADLTDDVSAGRGELVRSAVVLHGNARLHVGLDSRGGGQARAVIAPVLAGWSEDFVPPQEYPAGSDGPGPQRRGGTS